MVHDCIHCMMEWTKLWPFTVSVCLLCCIVSTHVGRAWRDSTDNSLYLWIPRNSQAARTSRCCRQFPEKGETIITLYIAWYLVRNQIWRLWWSALQQPIWFTVVESFFCAWQTIVNLRIIIVEMLN